MPLQWEPGGNPYVVNAFRILQLGAEATPNQIVAQSNNLVRKIQAGAVLSTGRKTLDFAVATQAATTLRSPQGLAEELLLIHIFDGP